jgi:hypothetical protein
MLASAVIRLAHMLIKEQQPGHSLTGRAMGCASRASKFNIKQGRPKVVMRTHIQHDGVVAQRVWPLPGGLRGDMPRRQQLMDNGQKTCTYVSTAIWLGHWECLSWTLQRAPAHSLASTHTHTD